MIDSSHTETLYDVIQLFREYITQNHGADSKTAQAYIRIADDFQRHVSNKDSSVPPELAVQEYYELTVGVPPFEAPPSKSKERYARAIRMIHDILHNEEPKRRYVNYPLRCPAPYQDILSRYESVMRDDHFGDKILPYFEIAGVDTTGKHHGLHSLRHSLATNLLESGTPVNEIAVILGHTSAASTKTYVWSDIERLRIAALEVPEK